MDPVPAHAFPPDAGFDGGDLDCGNGLLLLIRRHIDPLPEGRLLEIRSTESSVEEDLPAWCRLTGNALVSFVREGRQRSYLVCKGPWSGRPAAAAAARAGDPAAVAPPRGGLAVPVSVPDRLPPPAPAPAIPALAAGGIGSWPRPRWMLQAIQDYLAGRLDEAAFQATADDAVRLAVQAQAAAGAGWITDGEQRRDSYASFVGGRLDNCQLVPLTDLLPLVEDPEEFGRELRALDVPAAEVRHPVVFGRLGRSRPIAVHELAFARSLTDLPVKVALPGPYLLTRTLWLDCLLDKAYATREALAADVVRVLREEIHFLLAGGASLVQLDEPVLTEVVFTGPKSRRSFMCGALSEKGEAAAELRAAREWIDGVTEGLPRERLALHVCRGNWTTDEAALLAGDYRPLRELLFQVGVGTLFLEFSTPRAGELEALAGLPDDKRLGLGVVNPRSPSIESPEEIAARARRAIALFGRERLLLNSDCGFATFAANPVAPAEIAARKLRAVALAAGSLGR